MIVLITPTLEYVHSFTLHGPCQDEVEIALMQQKDSWKSNEKALAFVCETENGPILCASIPRYISNNDQSGPKSNSKAFGSRSTSPPKPNSPNSTVGMITVYFNSTTGQRQGFREIVNVSVGDEFLTLQKMLVAQNTYSEEIRHSINHVHLDSCGQLLYYTQTAKYSPKSYSSAMVYMLPAFIGLSYGNVNTSVSDRMQNSLERICYRLEKLLWWYSGELHRICSVELNLENCYQNDCIENRRIAIFM